MQDDKNEVCVGRIERDNTPIVIVIDGIIGAGKTTLINKCLVPILSDKGWKVTVIGEPVGKWADDGLLQKFYGDTERWGYHFQTKAFIDRVRESQLKFRKYKDCTDIFILERSIFSDRLFAEMLAESGKMSSMEFSHYKEWWALWEEVMPFEPDLFVYLKPTVDTCMARVGERNRDGEDGISIDYQTALLAKHDDFLGSDYVEINDGHFIPCIPLETDSNFRDDREVQHRVTKILEDKIADIRRNKFRS